MTADAGRYYINLRTGKLFETDPLMAAVRAAPFWICAGIGTVVFGLWSTKMRTIRSPMFVGFLIFTAGLVGMATVQPQHSTNAIVFDGLAGLGFGAPLILIVAGVQLATPHHVIATATAVLTSTRAVAASTFTAIYTAAYTTQAKTKLPRAVASAATAAGLSQHLDAFVEYAIAGNVTAMEAVPGVNATIVNAGLEGMKQGQADSYRIVWIIAAPFGILACIFVYFLDDMRTLMTYRVDAPVEELHAKSEAREEREVV